MKRLDRRSSHERLCDIETGVATAGPTATLLEVAHKLAAKRIGAILIVGTGGEIAGIVSERDIIRALSVLVPDCLAQPVSATMIKQVVTCQEKDTLGALVGIIS